MNWCSSQLENMIFLGNSLTSMTYIFNDLLCTKTVDKVTYVMDRLRYIWVIATYEFNTSSKLSLINKSKSYNPGMMFQNMYYHRFNFDGIDMSEEDMNNLLPSKLSSLSMCIYIFLIS